MKNFKTSSQIEDIEYNEDENTLIIKFKRGGSTYEYYDVPQHVYEKMVEADSVGKYFYAYIRDNYHCEKVK